MNGSAEVHNLPLALACNTKIGYYIQLNIARNSNFDVEDLPSDFKIIKNNGKSIFLMTEYLMYEGKKCKELGDEIHVMSNV